MGRGFKHTKVHMYESEWAYGVQFPHLSHHSLSCCTCIAFPSDVSTHGEKNTHMFIVRFCQPLHLRSDNDWFSYSDKSVVMNKHTFELLIVLKLQWSCTEPQPWHICFCYTNYVILFCKYQFNSLVIIVLPCSFVQLLFLMWRERGRLNSRFLSCEMCCRRVL